MIVGTRRSRRTLSAAVLAAAVLGAVLLATGETRWDAAFQAPMAAAVDDGLPGKGLPPSPGPTDPSGQVR
jgi:hypothetical protein